MAWIWIRVKINTLWAAIWALKAAGREAHMHARLSSSQLEEDEHRQEADEYAAQAEELHDSLVDAHKRPLTLVPKEDDK